MRALRPDVQSHGTTNQSPRADTVHHFGHVAIDDDGRMTVSLRSILGDVLHTKDLEPCHRFSEQNRWRAALTLATIELLRHPAAAPAT